MQKAFTMYENIITEDGEEKRVDYSDQVNALIDKGWTIDNVSVPESSTANAKKILVIAHKSDEEIVKEEAQKRMEEEEEIKKIREELKAENERPELK